MFGQGKSKNLLASTEGQIEMSIFSKRLREARKISKMSQERLGIEAGIDPASASARMNQYENDKHEPNINIVRQIADVLNLPTAYFYALEDDTARLLMLFHRLSEEKRLSLLNHVESVAGQN
ncbi:XRE family transcriptional regulator [Pseudomonas sp. FH4]|nr:XRE family transcriptional regulator [Pseudomonas sp. FH4]